MKKTFLFRNLSVVILMIFGLLVSRGAGAQTINLYAGNGTAGSSGDSDPAISAELNLGYGGGMAVDASGNLYIADYSNNRIRKVATDGTISTFAGTGSSTESVYSGSTPTSVGLNHPYDISINPSTGDIYFVTNYYVQEIVASTGLITTIAGNGAYYPENNGVSGLSSAVAPRAVSVDGSGNVFILDGTNVRVINSSGIIHLLTLSGSYSLNDPKGLAVDNTSGNIYVADYLVARIWVLSPSSGYTYTIAPFAGNGTSGYASGAPLSAEIDHPLGVLVDGSGNVYIADYYNSIVREVPSGSTTTMPTVAGIASTSGFSGDGGPAISAKMTRPGKLAMNAGGDLFIADITLNRIRKVDMDLQISGDNSVCVGSTTTHSLNAQVSGAPGTVGSGTWTASASGIVSFGSSTATSTTVTGVSAGTVTITYTETSDYNTFAVYSFTVNPLPATPAAISVSPSTALCPSATATLSDGTSGGSWSVSGLGSISGTTFTATSGGTTGGTSTVTYTSSATLYGCTSYVTTSITINPLPNAGTISGPSAVCVGSTISLASSGDITGSWTPTGSSDPADVSSSSGASAGVTGYSVGSESITYSVTNSCATAYTNVSLTVGPAIEITGVFESGSLDVSTSPLEYFTAEFTAPTSYAYLFSWVPEPGSSALVTITSPSGTGSTGSTTVYRSTDGSGSPAGGGNIYITLTSSCGSATWDVCSAYIEAYRGINNPTNTPLATYESLNLYPNPTTGTVTIEIPGKVDNATITLTNILGQVVETMNTGDNKVELNMTKNPRGVYMLQVKNGDNTYTRKIVFE